MPTRTKHLIIAITVLIVEILIATTFANIEFIRSYLGDFFVVILLYHSVKALGNVSPFKLATLIFIFSCAVEVAQYFHLADALGLPRGSLFSILIGTRFSWLDILAYFFGCLTSCLIDSRFFSTRPARGQP